MTVNSHLRLINGYRLLDNCYRRRNRLIIITIIHVVCSVVQIISIAVNNDRLINGRGNKHFIRWLVIRRAIIVAVRPYRKTNADKRMPVAAVVPTVMMSAIMTMPAVMAVPAVMAMIVMVMRIRIG